jgi:hypothetical protein
MTNTIEVAASLNSSGSLQTFDEEAVLSSDIVMPAQFYPAASTTPCQRLLAAILEDAIRGFQKNCDARSMRRHIIFQEAEAWLFDRHDTGFMSCQTVCESLGIEPIQLRRYLRKWKLNKQTGLVAPPVGRVRLTPTDPKITWPATRVSSSKRGQKRTGGMRS